MPTQWSIAWLSGLSADWTFCASPCSSEQKRDQDQKPHKKKMKEYLFFQITFWSENCLFCQINSWSSHNYFIATKIIIIFQIVLFKIKTNSINYDFQVFWKRKRHRWWRNGLNTARILEYIGTRWWNYCDFFIGKIGVTSGLRWSHGSGLLWILFFRISITFMIWVLLIRIYTVLLNLK